MYDDINEFDKKSVLIRGILNEEIASIYNINTSINREIFDLMNDILKTNYKVFLYFDLPNDPSYKMINLNSCLIYERSPNDLYIYIYLFHFNDIIKGINLISRLLEERGNSILMIQLNKTYEEKTIELCKEIGFVEGIQNSNNYINLEFYSDKDSNNECKNS